MSASGSINRSRVDGPNLKKLVCEKVEDRISRLPKELRTDIISRLPFRDALKTCILSRSWKRIFSSLPNLTLSEDQFLDVPNLDHRFSTLIDWTLENRDNSDLCSLDIHINLEQSGLTLKDTWVNYAVEHNVQYLNLIANFDETAGLPSCLFTSRSLEKFKLMARFEHLILPSAINLPNLKEMSLVSVNFPDDTLTENLFTGCPLLEFLSIRNCGFFTLTRLKISCPRLKTLLISDCVGIDTCTLDLQGTYIENFYYVGTLAQSFEFGNMSCLMKVVFNFTSDPTDERNYAELAPIAWNVLRELTYARDLLLSVLFYQVLTEVHQEFWRLNCFRNLESVQLFLWPSAECEEIVMKLLGKFCRVQNLKIFIFRIADSEDTFSMELNRENYRLQGIFEHLEHLEIENFEGLQLEMGLLVFFLQNAKSLRRVTIGTPQVTITHYGQNHLVSPVNYSLKQLITHMLRQFSDAYPTVAITVVEIP